MAETINGLYKAEVIYRRGLWRSVEAVDYTTLKGIDWFNDRFRNTLLDYHDGARYPRRQKVLQVAAGWVSC